MKNRKRRYAQEDFQQKELSYEKVSLGKFGSVQKMLEEEISIPSRPEILKPTEEGTNWNERIPAEEQNSTNNLIS